METANNQSIEVKEAKIELYGRVQGVLFRKNAKKFCDKHELKGFVENRNDGSVLISAQGSEKNLRDFIAWIKSNPGFLKVIDTKIEYPKISKLYESFEIVQKGLFLVDKSKAIFNLGRSFLKKEPGKIPRHVAIIPDGNRRWAREKGMNAVEGHHKSGEEDNIRSLLGEARNLGVKYLTLWAFSTENWNRNSKEIKTIFELVEKIVKKLGADAHKNKIRVRHLGRKDRMPKNLAVEIGKLEQKTKDYHDFNLQLCLDYGGRDEIVRAVNKILKEGKKKVDEGMIANSLDSAGIPDPDLIIRTSGEQRLSGFMPFQSDYAELMFIDKYFPDFKAEDLRQAVEEYGRRVRRFGGTNKKDLAVGNKELK